MKLPLTLTLSSEVLKERLKLYVNRLNVSQKEVLLQYKSQPGRLALRRLQSLLMTPPIPPDTHTSSYYRNEMISDLNDFTNDIIIGNITVSLKDLTADVSFTPFHLSHHGLNDKDFQIALYNAYNALCPDLNYISPHLLPQQSQEQEESKECKQRLHPIGSIERPLKIAFVSSHFYDHSIGRTLAETIVFLNQKQYDNPTNNVNNNINVNEPLPPFGNSILNLNLYLNLSVFLIDQSLTRMNKKRTDLITNVFENILGNRFIHVIDNIQETRAVLASYELDVLIFADLGMDFSSYALAFSRLATIQVCSA
eukprot:gene2642-5184_t